MRQKPGPPPGRLLRQFRESPADATVCTPFPYESYPLENRYIASRFCTRKEGPASAQRRMDRRHFLQTLAGLTAGIIARPAAGTDRLPGRDRLGDLLPLRRLGRTDLSVTMLGLGGWHLGNMSEKDAQRTIEVALEGGVRFFDSAESYQNGGSESYLGRFLVPKYRENVFVMTKTTAGDAAGVRRHLEESLQRLNTDYLDLWQVHSLRSPGDVDARIEREVLDVFIKAREDGKARHIGFTGHASPAAHRRMLERTDIFETCQMPVNVLDPSFESFVLQVLPSLVERDIGVLAMKTLANGRFFRSVSSADAVDSTSVVPGRISIEQALSFVWSLPVSVLITGPDTPEQLQEKIDLARGFSELTDTDRQALVDRVADLAGQQVEYYKA